MAWLLAVVGLVLVAACGLSDREEPTPSPSPSPASLSVDRTSEAGAGTVIGELLALQGAPSEAFGDVAAISLDDGTIAAAVATSGHAYELRVPPGLYLLVARTHGLGEGKDVLVSSGTVEVAEQGLSIDLPAMALGLRGARISLSSASQGTGGPVIGIGPIPMTGPPGWGPYGDISIVRGLLDPCHERGGRLVDLDPRIIAFIEREQALSDAGQLDHRLHIRRIPPTAVIDGNVTVGGDGEPVVEVTVTNTSGEVIIHLVDQGTPADSRDVGDFLFRFGRSLAAELCQNTNIHIEVEGPGGIQYYVRNHEGAVTCWDSCDVPIADFRFDLDLQRTTAPADLYEGERREGDLEQGARLVAWGGACADVDALSQPRGGVCRIKDTGSGQVVTARFEIRPRLEVQMTGKSGWFKLTYEPEQSLASSGGGQGLRITCGQPPCSIEFYYDEDTTVTLESANGNSGFLRHWGGGCSGTPGWSDDNSTPAQPCTITLSDDTTVTIQFSSVQCTNGNCTYDPP